MTFADLHYSVVLIPAFLLWLLLLFFLPRLSRAQRPSAIRFSSLKNVLSLPGSSAIALRRFFQAFRLVCVALLMVAMLRPQTGRTLTEVNAEGIDIMLVLDTSGSMQALDLDDAKELSERRNRLQVAKEVVSRFVEGRPNDQVGLVVFGGQAFTQCPLTLDHGVLSTLLDQIEIGIAGDATALGSAIGTAVKRLRDSTAKSKVIVALTDGVNNAGTLAPTVAAEIAKTFDIKIYTVAAGVRGEAPFLVDTRLGPQVFYQPNTIDEETLQKIAEMTEGQYFRAEDETALAEIYAQIDELEKTEIEMQQYMEYDEKYRWLLVPALALLLIELLMLGTRYRKLP